MMAQNKMIGNEKVFKNRNIKTFGFIEEKKNISKYNNNNNNLFKFLKRKDAFMMKFIGTWQH